MMAYTKPNFIPETISQQQYGKWLTRKANAHVRRDRRRGNTTATVKEYKEAIHEAVINSQGFDAYTGESLDWELICKYNNKEAQKGGRAYKKLFALLPSVDHVDDGKGPANFKICSWQTNDAKNDLTLEEFIGLCKKIIKFEHDKNLSNKSNITDM